MPPSKRFEVALEVNRSVGEDEAREAILRATRSMLRSTEATLTSSEPAGDTLHAPVDLIHDRRGPSWKLRDTAEDGSPWQVVLSPSTPLAVFEAALRAAVESAGAE